MKFVILVAIALMVMGLVWWIAIPGALMIEGQMQP